ncbi:MAG: hybrid sensor histidine kinase/response regulator [Pseudomonadota bacterium]|nr:hybrid sensor histidine kinase/response regulator [Pseudomonadota bacterium]
MTKQRKKQSKIHVVLIEDSSVTAAIITSKLAEITEYRLSHYPSGEDFFARFNLRSTPDIFLIDSIIDDTSGNQLTSGVDIVARLKTVNRYKNIPVIMLSTVGDEDDPKFKQMVKTFYYQQKIRGLMAGAADVIYKPHGIDLESDPSSFPVDELLYKVRILTQRRLLQLELRRKNRQLRQKNRELAKLNHNYINVLSFVSHEFRNSLVVVGGFLRRLLRKVEGESEQRDLNSIISNCEFMEDMIDRYLIISRIEMGRLNLNVTEIDDFYPIIIEPVFKRLGKKKLIERIEYDGPLKLTEIQLNADRYLLQIVFSNLFNNAIKYGSSEGKIRYGVETQEKGLRFHVWNEGPGIAADKINQVFRRFQRLKDKNIPEQNGIGLGLYSVKEIVELHGGKIRVESEYGKWVDFIFWLPELSV